MLGINGRLLLSVCFKMNVMLYFEKITPAFLKANRAVINRTGIRLCDYSVGCLYLWSESFHTFGCIENDTFFSAVYADNETNFYYGFPIGGDIGMAFKLIADDADKRKLSPCFCYVPEERLESVFSIFGKQKEITFNEDWQDYLYPYKNFLGFNGKKLHTPRNHLNAFNKNSESRFEALSSSNAETAKAFLVNNRDEFSKGDSLSKSELDNAINFIDDVFSLGLNGGLLYANNDCIGLTIGEVISDTLHIHTEKALKAYDGSFQALAMNFAVMMQNPSVKYINRQEDMGIEGLRRSKTSYRPCTLLKKYTIKY